MGKILVVDDDQTVAGLRAQLRASGHEIDSAPDAFTCLRVAAKARPDLILISVNLPGGGVAKLLERLRGDAGSPALPVVYLFGQWDKTDEFSKDPHGRLLQKPANADALKALVEELVPASSGEGAAAGLDEDGFERGLPPAAAPLGRPVAMDMGAPSDDDITPGETIEL
jgi:CheY-like chemotaxis protein